MLTLREKIATINSSKKKPKEILPWALCLLVILKNNLLD